MSDQQPYGVCAAMEHKQPRLLKDESLVCPRCGFQKNRASDGWCWSCGVMLPADWWRK